MNTVLGLTLLLLSSDQPVVLAPPTSLALDVAEGVGALVEKLAISSDQSVTAAEVEQVKAALARTGLFQVVPASEAAATLNLVRVDPDALLATVQSADGRRLLVRRVTWSQATHPPSLVGAGRGGIPGTDSSTGAGATPGPSATPEAGKISDIGAARSNDETPGAGPAAGANGVAGAQALPPSEATYQKVLAYEREHLRLVPVVRSYVPTPFYDVWGSRWHPDPYRWHVGFGGPVPIGTAPNDWVIMRGAAEVVEDLELAKLLRDEQLVHEIEEDRFWPRLAWVSGFGAGALAAVGTGTWLAGERDRDTRTLGVSLITLGAVSAVLALLAPTVGTGHYFSALAAQTYVDQYNQQLRQQLGVRAEDLSAFPSRN